MKERRSPIDLSLFDAATEGDKGLQKEVLALFLTQLPQYIEAVECHDGDALKAAAHRLRGAAQSIGALPIARLSDSLESGTYSGSKKTAVRALKEEAERLKKLILNP